MDGQQRETVGEAVNRAIIAYDLARRQERDLVRAERDSMRRLLAAIVQQAGGEIAVSRRILDSLDLAVEYMHDEDNRCIRVRSYPLGRRPDVKAERVECGPMPDWML